MRKGLSLLLTIALLVGGTAGCSGKTDIPATEPEEQTEAQAEIEAPKQEETVGEEKLKVGILFKTLASEYWVATVGGIKEETENLGVEVEIMATTSESGTGSQLQTLEDMVSKDYDGIGVVPITDTNLIPGVASACKKGAPIVDLDQESNAEELKNVGGWVIGYCTTDYVVTGQQAGEFLAGKMENQGRAIIIERMAGNLSSESRKKGCTEVPEKAGIEIVAPQPCDWDRQRAMDTTTNLMSVYSGATGIYCCNDTMASGAQQAANVLNLQGKIFVVRTDGNGEAIESIVNGEMAGTVAQRSGGIGAICLRIPVDAIKSGEIGDVNMELGTELLDSFIISPENMSEHRN